MDLEDNDILNMVDDEVEEEIADVEEEVVEEGVTDEAVAADEDASKPEEKEPQRKEESVPAHVLVHERRKWQKKLDAFKEQLGKYETLDERLRAFEEQQQQQSIPDQSLDPIGHLDYRAQQQDEQLKTVSEQLSQLSQQNQQQQYIQQINQAIRNSEASVVSEHEDYYDALNHVRAIESQKYSMFPDEALDQQLKAYGTQHLPDSREEKVAMIMGYMETQAAAALIQQGVNPAQYVYKMAQAYGYKGNIDEGTVKEGSEEGGGLDKLERGMAAASTLGSGGSEKKGGKTKEEIDSMTPHEFDEAMKEMFGQ